MTISDWHILPAVQCSTAVNCVMLRGLKHQCVIRHFKIHMTILGSMHWKECITISVVQQEYTIAAKYIVHSQVLVSLYHTGRLRQSCIDYGLCYTWLLMRICYVSSVVYVESYHVTDTCKYSSMEFSWLRQLWVVVSIIFFCSLVCVQYNTRKYVLHWTQTKEQKTGEAWEWG